MNYVPRDITESQKSNCINERTKTLWSEKKLRVINFALRLQNLPTIEKQSEKGFKQ